MPITPKQFLTELKTYSQEKYSIVKQLRDIIFDIDESVIEEIKYGGLLYSHNKPYTGLFVYKNHVTMEFTEGYKLTDPKRLLAGSGKYRRNITFVSSTDINDVAIKNFLKQALKLQ